MCWFGSETKKPMVMYTNAKWIEDIELFQMFEWSKKKIAEHLAMQKPNNEGKLCYYGKPRMLQQSGMYTKEFGESMAELFSRHRKEWSKKVGAIQKLCTCKECPPAEELLMGQGQPHEDQWCEVQLDSVLSRVQTDAKKICSVLLIPEVDIGS